VSEQFELLEDRLISGRGNVRIPTDADLRYFRLYLDIIRLPSVNFLNFLFPRDKGFFARGLFMVGPYVYKEFDIRYERTVLDFEPWEPSGWLASPLACSFQAVYNQNNAIFLFLTGTPGLPGEPIFFEPVSKEVSSIVLECRDETAFQLRLYGLRQDVQCSEGEPTPKEPPPPPPPLPPVLPGVGIGVSPPYDDPPGSEDTDTSPLPQDTIDDPEIEELIPPIGADCQRFLVNTIVTFINNEGVEETTETSTIYFGPLTGYGYQPGANPGSRTWGVYSRGGAFFGCQEPGFYNNGELANQTEGSVEFISATPLD